MIKKIAGFAIASAMLVLPAAALAGGPDGSTTTQIGVDATVIPNCTMQGGGIHFGAYDPLVANRSADLLGYGGPGVTCTKGTPAVLKAPATSQVMTDAGGDQLAYTLTYQGPYGGQGVTGDPFTTSSLWGINKPWHLNFVGDITAGQDVPVGTYSGSATVEVDF